jgi:hypothetical protein
MGARWTGSGWPTRDYYRTPNDGSDPNSAGNVWPVDIYTHINILYQLCSLGVGLENISGTRPFGTR